MCDECKLSDGERRDIDEHNHKADGLGLKRINPHEIEERRVRERHKERSFDEIWSMRCDD